MKENKQVLGSAVNPVIREGNSDRRVAAPVKRHAQRSTPPVRMREWSKDSKTHVAHMKKGDFFGSEKSATIEKPTSVSIEFVGADGSKKLLKKELKLKVSLAELFLFSFSLIDHARPAKWLTPVSCRAPLFVSSLLTRLLMLLRRRSCCLCT